MGGKIRYRVRFSQNGHDTSRVLKSHDAVIVVDERHRFLRGKRRRANAKTRRNLLYASLLRNQRKERASRSPRDLIPVFQGIVITRFSLIRSREVTQERTIGRRHHRDRAPCESSLATGKLERSMYQRFEFFSRPTPVPRRWVAAGIISGRHARDPRVLNDKSD